MSDMQRFIGFLAIVGIIALASPIAAFWFAVVTLTIGFFIAKWEDSDWAAGIRENKAAYRKVGQKPPSYAGGFYVVLAIIIFTAICGVISPNNRPAQTQTHYCNNSYEICERYR